jgi:hypothetical protein
MATASDPKHGRKDNSLNAPALQFAAVTPTDSAAFAFGLARGLYIGTGGNVVVYDADGNAVTFKNAANGSMLPIRAGGVAATNTSAADIVALY